MTRGTRLQLERLEENYTVVTRRGAIARVIKADIACTNGVIHLIGTNTSILISSWQCSLFLLDS